MLHGLSLRRLAIAAVALVVLLPACRFRSQLEPETEAVCFREATQEIGLSFKHRLKEGEAFYFPNIVGSGCGMLDYDLDGDMDVFLASFGDRENRLYESAAGKLTDVTSQAGLDEGRLATGVATGDINNDGYPDLYVSSVERDSLYLNNADGTFTDITGQAGIENLSWGLSACFFDYDQDGWLDLYVTNYVEYHRRPCTGPGGGGEDFCSPREFPAQPDRLFKNLGSEPPGGEVRFADVSEIAGITKVTAPAMGVMSWDINQDGWLDLYVANDQQANVAWINLQDGTFRNEAITRGCAYDALGKAQASMGLALADTNQDGELDLLSTHLTSEYTTLYESRDGGTFQDVSTRLGLRATTLSTTGFGTAFADLNCDQKLELLIVNGGVRRWNSTEDVKDFWYPYRQRNLILCQGDAGFEVCLADDPFGEALEVSRGMTVGDLDNDGGLDVLVTNIGEDARLFINQAPNANWLTVRALDGRFGKRDDFGATVKVISGESSQIRLVQTAGSYLSAMDPRCHFGLGEMKRIDAIEVRWSDGIIESFPGGAANRFIEIVRKNDE